MDQLEINFSGPQLRDMGIQKAIDHADQKIPKWSEKAYEFLSGYIKNHSEFLVEEVRAAAKGKLEDPPSNRAWGGIVRRAAKSGLIIRKGFKAVKNPKAHCTPATLWKTI